MNNIKPEVSEKNDYYISKHRYYELKHFCLQHKEKKAALAELEGYIKNRKDGLANPDGKEWSDPVHDVAGAREYYIESMRVVEDTCYEVDQVLGRYLLKAVTEDRSYDNIQTMMGIPCSRYMFYKLYRQFFWLLHRNIQSLQTKIYHS